MITLLINLFCIAVGFFIKLGFDHYHQFILRQEDSLNKMTTAMAKWELMAEEKSKNL